MIIQDISSLKPRFKAHSKISILPLHNTATLETWRRRFGFINEKVIKQLLSIATGIEITDLNTLKS